MRTAQLNLESKFGLVRIQWGRAYFSFESFVTKQQWKKLKCYIHSSTWTAGRKLQMVIASSLFPVCNGVSKESKIMHAVKMPEIMNLKK